MDRRIGSILSSEKSDAEKANAIMDFANAPGDGETNCSLLKLVGSIVGLVWGTSIVSAGLSVTTGVVALGLGIELAPIFSYYNWLISYFLFIVVNIVSQ